MASERPEHQDTQELMPRVPENNRNNGKVIRSVRIAVMAVAVVLGLGLCWTFFSRWSESKALDERATQNAVIYVSVVKVEATTNERLTLPGTLQGVLEAQIYARTNGYVKKWFKDIGSSVKKGEVLASLDLPDIARQVDEAVANYELAKSAYVRWRQLRIDDAVSQQELDEKTSAYRQTEAALKRIREQQRFGQVLAPFDGIVTRRNINVGDLVNAGNSGSAQALFTVVQADTLRLYVYVSQDRASLIQVGDSVDIIQSDKPNEKIKGRIVRTAGAIDSGSRTMQVEIEVPNANRALMPGAYVEVAMNFKASGTLLLPTNTLLFGTGGTQVAVVKDGKAVRQTVVLGTDYGRRVEVKSGVSAEDVVIVNPPDSIASDQEVAIQKPAKNPSGDTSTKPGT